MRYILYFFTMALVFVGGMLVGNMYLPARNASLATAIAVPGEPQNNMLLQCTRPQAEQNLAFLSQALSSCPVVVGEEKDRLIHQINLLLARQDFEIKKARFELEIAKNSIENRTTSEFVKASSDYTSALALLEELLNTYFPQHAEPATEVEKKEPSSATQEKVLPVVPNKATPAAPEKVNAKTEKPNTPLKTEAKPVEPKSSKTPETEKASPVSPSAATPAPAAQPTLLSVPAAQPAPSASSKTVKKSPAEKQTGEQRK